MQVGKSHRRNEITSFPLKICFKAQFAMKIFIGIFII